MELTPEVQAACIKVAGDWDITIATWTKEHTPKEKRVIGNALLHKHFQKSYSYLTQMAGK